MNLNEFVKGYIESPNKNGFMNRHITTNYIGYATKVSKCSRIIEVTTSKEINGINTYHVDSTARFLLYTLTLIDCYFDVEIDFSQPMLCFDLLSENGIVAEALKVIPEQEQQMFKLVFEMIRDDVYSNTREFASYMDIKINAFADLIGVIVDKAIELFGDEYNLGDLVKSNSKDQ